MTADCMTFPEKVSDGVLNAMAEVHPDYSDVCMMARELIELRKRLADAALVEQGLREELAALRGRCEWITIETVAVK